MLVTGALRREHATGRRGFEQRRVGRGRATHRADAQTVGVKSLDDVDGGDVDEIDGGP